MKPWWQKIVENADRERETFRRGFAWGLFAGFGTVSLLLWWLHALRGLR